METKPRLWWAVLALTAFGCSSGSDSAKTGDEPGTISSNLLTPISDGLDVNALATQAAVAADAPCPSCGISVTPNTGLRRVLLLSIDGMHAADYYKYVANNPRSNIGRLYLHGIDYPNATTTTPSGGFPGILAIATGASPKTTGVYDEDSFDRTLYPPGSNCVGATGTEVIYDSSIAEDWTLPFSPINKANLPLFKNSQGQCVEVYPHNFLKTPTVFEVIQASGRRTAWGDNRASYEILSGPSGKGISELYTPDISSSLQLGGTPNGVNLPASEALCSSDNAYGTPPFSYRTCIPAASALDDTKVQALINKIDGFAADGSRQSAVPTILGMSFGAVDVAQKLPVGGYLNNAGDPKPALQAALDHVDFSIGRILTELDTKHFIDKTLIILTAKHAQAPIDPAKWRTLDTAATGLSVVASDPRSVVQGADSTVDSTTATFVNPNSMVSPSTTGHVQLADSGIVWLKNQNNVNVTNVVQALTNATNVAAMSATVRPQGSIFSTNIVTGTELTQAYGDAQSSTDLLAAARAPNAFVQPELGVIYEHVTNQNAEHGGGAQDDINVPLLISNTGIVNHVSLIQPVSTEQVALTILRALTLDGTKLTGASAEGTSALPGIVWGPGTYQGGSTVNAVDYSSQTNTTTVTGPPSYIGSFNAGSSICFNDVYLTDVVSITVTYASANTATNNALSVRVDGPNGTKVGQVTVPSTGGWTTWKTLSIPISPAQTGLHTLCLRGEVGSGIANLLNFSLVPVCVPECTNATCGSDGCGGVCGTCGFNFLCDEPFAQCIVPPTKYSVVTPSLPSLIPAPAYDVQSGTALSGTTAVQSFDTNDYTCYYGVELTNVQKIVATLASAAAGGTFSFRIDSPTGTTIASYTVPSTGGATAFKSKQIALNGPYVGVHALCVRGETGTNIATLQSFQLSDQPVLPKYTVGSTITASPADSQQGTTNDPGGYISNFDVNDFVCYEDVDLAGVNSIVANVASATGGGTFSARTGSQSGPRIATFRVPNTGSWTTFTNVGSNITTSSGLTTLCFVGESGNGIANLKSFTLSSTIIPSKYQVGSVIPATPPDSQQGTTNDPGGYISNFDVNDYYCYDSVDMTGVNSLVVNVASANSGGVFSVRVGSPTGTRVGQSVVLSTGSWTTFTNLNVAIAGASGITTLCITGDSNNGIGNVKSITLSSAVVSKNYSLGQVIPGAPPSSQTGITVNGTTITYFDVNDWFCYDGIDLTGVHTLVVRAASGSAGNRFSVRIGSQNGFQIGSFTTTNTGGYNTYANWNVGISNSPGVQKLCFFGTQGTGIANIQSVTLNP